MKRYVLRYWMLVGLLALVGGVPLVGQGGYGKLIADEHGIMRNLNIDDIVYHNDHLYVRGNKWIDSIGIWGLFVAQLDTNGTILWQNTIYDTTLQTSYTVNTPTRFNIADDGEIMLPNKYFHLGRIAFTVLDSSGVESFTKSYSHVGRTIYPMEVMKYDNYYYLFGRVQRLDYEGDCYVLKVDSLGSLVWLKYFGLTDFEEGFGGVVMHPNGTFTISSYRTTKEFYTSGPLIEGWKAPWIFTIDTSGVIVDEWLGEENDTTTLGGGSISKLPNGNWVVTSRDIKVVLDNGIYDLAVSPTISCLDSNFNFQWKNNVLGYENKWNHLDDMKYDKNRDEIVVCGHKNVIYSEDFSKWEIWVFKLKPDGEIIWNISDTIQYGANESHVVAGVDIAPSGSIYVSGYISNSGLARGYILKISPDGCTDTLCTTTSIEEQIRNWNDNVLFYPNPAQDILKVQIKDLSTSGVLQIFDLQGRIVKRKSVKQGTNTIDLNLISGIYVCTITSKGNIVYSEKIVVQ